MAQVTGVGFANFRVFKANTFFDFAPISIFTGTNSSGKSSIFKGLRLASDNANDPNKLIFSGDNHKLGTFEKALTFNSEAKEFEFRLKVNQGRGVNIVDDLTFVGIYANDKKYSENAVLVKSKILAEGCGNTVLAEIEEAEGTINLYVNLEFILARIRSEKIPYAQKVYDEIASSQGSLPLEFDYTWFDFINYDFSIIDKKKLKDLLRSSSSNTIETICKALEKQVIEGFSNITFNGMETNDATLMTVDTYHDYLKKYGEALNTNYFYFIQKVLKVKALELLGEDFVGNYLPISVLGDITIKEIISEQFLLLCQDIVAPQIHVINQNLKQAFEEVKYVEAVRANSQRLYTNQSQGTAFNKLLLDLGQTWEKFQHTDEYGFTAKGFVESWLKKFSIGDSISINRVKGIATEVIVERKGQKIDLIDLGYGVTQFLPILLYIAYNLDSKGKTNHLQSLGYNIDSSYAVVPLLLIEEPESNLHPKLQSLLADFFLDVIVNFHVTLLIETHSEYLIRRLQVLTAAGEAKPEDSVIYYLDGNLSDDSDKFAKRININSDGSLTNDFGPGFIDEATNWKMELMRLRNSHLYTAN